MRERLTTVALVAATVGPEWKQLLAVVPEGTHPASVVVACMILAIPGGALVARRRWPAPVLVVAVVAGEAVHAVMPLPQEVPYGFAALAAIYCCGRYLSVWAGWAAGAGMALLVASQALDGEPQGDWMIGIALVVLLVLLGQYVRGWKYLAARQRATQAEQAVRAERQRIARELHDVVAHHITVMNVLIGAARTTMAHDPAAAEEAMSTAERTGREAMAEMRQLLAVLRAERTDDTEQGVPAGTAQLPSLVTRTRAADLRVQLEITGRRRDLPAAVDLAVYRVAQEALTNAQRHGGESVSVQVRLRYEPTTVSIEVVDDGRPSGQRTGTPDGTGAGGYGLSGMAERVALCGGEFQAGPRPDSGFRVYASLPAPATQEPDAEVDERVATAVVEPDLASGARAERAR